MEGKNLHSIQPKGDLIFVFSTYTHPATCKYTNCTTNASRVRIMFWAGGSMLNLTTAKHSPSIWMSGMDGSDVTKVIPNVTAALLTIDHSTQLLFWLERKAAVRPWGRMEYYAIFHCQLNGKGIKRTTVLSHPPSRLRLAGSKLFWLDKTSFLQNVLVSCDKRNGSNLQAHALYGAQASVVDFLILEPTTTTVSSGTQSEYYDRCIPDALCSHMCVPSATGYMRCFCPLQYELGADGWTCGEH